MMEVVVKLFGEGWVLQDDGGVNDDLVELWEDLEFGFEVIEFGCREVGMAEGVDVSELGWRGLSLCIL